MPRPAATARIPVIADVDTGLDDALALAYLTASPAVDLRAVTCVDGNTDVDQVVTNTLTVLDMVGAPPIPVAAGARRPLINQPHHAHAFHGSDGLGDLGLPAPTRRPVGTAAVELIRDTVEANPEPVTLLALAPLTNIALFLRTYPEHAARLARIVFMGGAVATGNATPVAEFNAWHDPEALHLVLNSGVPATMYPLDVFMEPAVDRSTIAAWTSAPDPALRLVGQLLTALGRHDAPEDAVCIGDAGAACYLTHPELGTVTRHPTRVQLVGADRGQTVVDRRPRTGEAEQHGQAEATAALDVVTSHDAAAVAQAFTTAIAQRPAAPLGAAG